MEQTVFGKLQLGTWSIALEPSDGDLLLPFNSLSNGRLEAGIKIANNARMLLEHQDISEMLQ